MRPNAVFNMRGSVAPQSTLERSTPRTEETPPGSTLHRFPCSIAPHLVALRVLGEGGTAIVYEALHLRLNITVAVKVLRSSGTSEDFSPARLLREAELCARIDSTRVPRVYDVDTFADGTPYVVMDIIRGRSLEEVLQHGPLDVDVACAITSEVLRAVGDLHASGVVHRDIKPGNLMVEDHPRHGLRVRVLDLGIAHPLPRPREKPWEDRARLTQQGMLVGTPHYMASEQLCGDHADERTDIYAVGVMLYEMLSGNTPYDGDSANEVITAAMRHEPRPLSELRPEVPLCLQHIVMRAMHKDPAQRFASTQEMLFAIRDFHANENTWRLTLPPQGHLRPAHGMREAPRRFSAARAVLLPLIVSAVMGTAAFPSATADSGMNMFEFAARAPEVAKPVAHEGTLRDPPHLSLSWPAFRLSLSQEGVPLSHGANEGEQRFSAPLPQAHEAERSEGDRSEPARSERRTHDGVEPKGDEAESSEPEQAAELREERDADVTPGIPLNPYLERLEALLSADEPPLLDPFADEPPVPVE